MPGPVARAFWPLVVLLAACNQPPGAPTVAIEPEEPTTLDDLVARIAVEAEDPRGGEALAYRFAWQQDGVAREDVTDDTVPAGLTAKGETWTVEVIAWDGEFEGPPGTASVAILNSAPVAEVAIAPAVPLSSDDLTATVSATDDDLDPVSLTCSWTVDGADAGIADVTVPASATTRGETWQVTVVSSDGEDEGAPATASVVIENEAPVVRSATLGPEPAYEADTLQVALEAEDPDGDEVQATYAWYVDEVLVLEEASGRLDGGAFDKHQRVVAVVTPSDGFVAGEPLETNEVEIRNTPPALASVAIDPPTATEDSVLTCVPAGWSDDDGDAEGYALSWQIDGVEVGTGVTLDGASFDRGDDVVCVATPFDGEDAGAPVGSAALTVDNSPPSVASATLSTTSPTDADTLTVSVGGASDPDGDPVILAYAWYVDGTLAAAVPALDGSYFDRGDAIWAVVTPSDGRDDGAPVTSDVATAVNAVPVVSSVSILPSTLTTDATATASVVSTDADGDTVTLGYAWRVDGAVVSATGASLAGSAWFDKGQSVAVTVTPNDGFVDGTAVSAGPVTVSNSPPTAPTVAISPAEPVAGVDDLGCSVVVASTDADSDTISYTFAWTRDGVAFSGTTTDVWPGDTVPAAAVADGETWVCAGTPSDGSATGSAGTASVDIGGGSCTWPSLGVTASTGPATGPTFTPVYLGIEAVFVAEDSVLYDWEYTAGPDTAYVEFVFFDASWNDCGVIYDLTGAVSATGWTTDSGGALYDAWEIDTSDGYTTCTAIRPTTWGTNDVRDLIEAWIWGLAVGEMTPSYESALAASITADGGDWAADWEPYVVSGYIWSDLWGEAWELDFVRGYQETCGVVDEDAAGDLIDLAPPTAGPIADGIYTLGAFYVVYADSLIP